MIYVVESLPAGFRDRTATIDRSRPEGFEAPVEIGFGFGLVPKDREGENEVLLGTGDTICIVEALRKPFVRPSPATSTGMPVRPDGESKPRSGTRANTQADRRRGAER